VGCRGGGRGESRPAGSVVLGDLVLGVKMGEADLATLWGEVH
jgi:hypothetical protein